MIQQIPFFSKFRKLKNRVAAQTARDRKKELMGTLEHQVTKLMEQNKRLLEENQKLKSQSSNLLHENQQLKERLGNNVSLVGTKSETLGSAVSFDLLPWGQPQTLSRSMMPYATSVLTMRYFLILVDCLVERNVIKYKSMWEIHMQVHV